MKLLLVLTLFFATANFSLAENIKDLPKTTQITGRILDARTQEALEGTKVEIEELGITIYTDANGTFSFVGELEKEYEVQLELISYEKIKRNISAKQPIAMFTLQEVD